MTTLYIGPDQATAYRLQVPEGAFDLLLWPIKKASSEPKRAPTPKRPPRKSAVAQWVAEIHARDEALDIEMGRFTEGFGCANEAMREQMVRNYTRSQGFDIDDRGRVDFSSDK